MSEIIDLADAILNFIQNGNFGMAFEALRYYTPIYDLGELDNLVLAIVPRSWTISFISRVHDEKNIIIDIGINCRIKNDDECDNLIDFCRRIVEFFRGFKYQKFWCMERKIDPIYDPEYLLQNRQFASVISLSFKEIV